MLTTTESRVVAEIPEKDNPILSDSNNESVIDRVPVPEALSAESDASICDEVTM